MLPGDVRIFVCTQAQDMRRSFDGLALATQELVGEDPRSGALFIFVGKTMTRMKVLWWDRNGYCLLYKRLHQAVFELPKHADGKSSVRIDAQRLAQLLGGIARTSRRKILTRDLQ